MLEDLLQHQRQLLVIPGFADVAVDLPVVDCLDDGGQVSVAGQQDTTGGGIQTMHLGQQRCPVHAGHACIAHYQVNGPTGHDLEGLGAAGRQHHVVGLATQQAAQAVENRLFIVHKQHSRLGSEWFIHGNSALIKPSWATLSRCIVPCSVADGPHTAIAVDLTPTGRRYQGSSTMLS